MIQPRYKLKLVRSVSYLGALFCLLIFIANLFDHNSHNLISYLTSSVLGVFFLLIATTLRQQKHATAAGLAVSVAAILALTLQLLLVQPESPLLGRTDGYYFAAIIVFSSFVVGPRWGGVCVAIATVVYTYLFVTRPPTAIGIDGSIQSHGITTLIDPLLSFFFSYLVIVAAGLTIETMMQEMSRQAKELDDKRTLASLGYFISGIVHEIRNPLAVISGASTITEHSLRTLRKKLPVQPKESHKELEKSVEKLAQLNDKASKASDKIGAIVEGLLHLVRPIDLDNLKKRHRIDVATIFEELYESYEDQLIAEHIDFQCPIAADLFVEVFAERYHIYSALRIFVSNSIEAFALASMHEGEADLERVKGGKRVIRLEVELVSEQRLRLTVFDNGPGVAPAAQASIFREIYSSKKDGLGTGIGLSFVKAMADILGWRPGFASEVGASRFWLELPGVMQRRSHADQATEAAELPRRAS